MDPTPISCEESNSISKGLDQYMPRRKRNDNTYRITE